MNKEYLRIKYKKIRNNISNKELKSQLITNTIINLNEYINSQSIAIYSSFSNEVDTSNLIIYSIKNNKKVYLPVIKGKHYMDFYLVNNLKDITIQNKYGIKEPLPKIENKLITNPDIIIIPGLCFDKNKNRLGFGGGYYDSYLEKNKSLKVAICYEEQILKDEIIKTTPHDIKMDIIITDQKIYR